MNANMNTSVVEGRNRTNFSSNQNIGPFEKANLLGIFIASATGATIKVEDAGGIIANTFVPVAGTFYPLPCNVYGALKITVSGTIDGTAFWS